MTPPKPPRTKSTTTSSYDVRQQAYEDLDAPVLAATDGSQSEVKVKPVPRPRTKLPPKSQCSNNTVDAADTTSNTTSAVSSQLSGPPADYKTPIPVRPPPRPPLSKCMTASKPTAAVDGCSRYITSISEPTVTSSAARTERIRTPTPPRPPPPNIYCNRPRSTMRLTSESYTDESQRSSPTSSMQQSAVSPAVSEEEGNLGWTYSTTAPDSTDTPAVPPRTGHSSLPFSASVYETLPPQTRPPPPSFTPPPPPSIERPSESVYSEIENRPYLDVLPEDGDTITQGRPTLRYPSVCHSSRQQSTEDTEDINGMLRWLKRVSKPDSMAPSLYGLSIEEEIRSFNERAMNVRKALRLYNLLMMKRHDCLQKVITEFIAISDSLDKIKKKAKTMSIAGGTTGAIGGVTAVVGIALAPMTMGVSLIATAVGAGIVASAGGMGAHTAKANKKIVNRMTVEKLVYEYKGIVDLEHCLCFILSVMNELRRHDIPRLQRALAQPHALKMAHLSQFVFNMNSGRTTSIANAGGMSSERLLQAFAKDIDLYFTEKADQKLNKSKKSKFSGRVRLLAKNLQDELDHLNRMWEMFG